MSSASGFAALPRCAGADHSAPGGAANDNEDAPETAGLINKDGAEKPASMDRRHSQRDNWEVRSAARGAACPPARGHAQCVHRTPWLNDGLAAQGIPVYTSTSRAYLTVYAAATLATVIKTIAWW
jgi:hypothetical protein